MAVCLHCLQLGLGRPSPNALANAGHDTRALQDRPIQTDREEGMPSGVLVYTIGLVLAVILTATSFRVANTSLLWGPRCFPRAYRAPKQPVIPNPAKTPLPLGRLSLLGLRFARRPRRNNGGITRRAGCPFLGQQAVFDREVPPFGREFWIGGAAANRAFFDVYDREVQSNRRRLRKRWWHRLIAL